MYRVCICDVLGRVLWIFSGVWLAACDASLTRDAQGRARTGIGIWTGVQPGRAQGGQGDTADGRTGSGMWGMATPATWTICDLEMYCILRYLRKVVVPAELAGALF